MNTWYKVKRITVLLMMVSLLSPSYSANKKVSQKEVFKVPPLYLPVPMPDKTWKIPDVGPIGIGIQLEKPGFTMRIISIDKGSPAEATGKLKIKQIIESINGKTLGTEMDPRIVLGDIITEAEASDGVILLTIKDVGEVKVTIPVMGDYSATWPLGCEKSDKIVGRLAEYLAEEKNPSWGSSLFLLSTGEDKYLPIVKDRLSKAEKIGAYPWHFGYLGPAYCEYYLRTGDKSVLPVINRTLVELKTMMYNGGWTSKGHGGTFKYGQINGAGVHCLTFILLAKLCDADVDDYMLQRSLKHFYRFVGHGTVPYGDHWPEGGYRDNGKTGALGISMAAAARLMPNGEKSVYAKARDLSSIKSFYATNWFHAPHTGGGIGEIWHHGSMSLVRDRYPVPFDRYCRHGGPLRCIRIRWWYGVGKLLRPHDLYSPAEKTDPVRSAQNRVLQGVSTAGPSLGQSCR